MCECRASKVSVTTTVIKYRCVLDVIQLEHKQNSNIPIKSDLSQESASVNVLMCNLNH